MPIINRKFYQGSEYEIDEVTQTLRLKPAFLALLQAKGLPFKRGFKKVGGSMLGDVLAVEKLKSQFAAFCNIANIGLPILDEKYVRAGQIIEPKVIAAIEQTTGKLVKRFPAQEYKYDYFAEVDEVVGGLPDGYIENDKRVLEIKTAGINKLRQWEKWGLPVGYIKQASLYAYLMQAKDFAIVATFLEEEDYAEPEQFPIKRRIIKNWNFPINEAMIKDDIAKVKALYQDWTTSGISPRFDPVLDADLLAWLKCANEEEWKALQAQWISTKKLVV